MSNKILPGFEQIFSERLRQVRLEKKLEQAELAEKIGISHVAISQFESGSNLPASKTFVALGQALDVSLDWLAGRTDDRKVHQKRKELK